MVNGSSIDKSRNKNFIINNQLFLKHYALENYELVGQGIIVINLLLLKTDILDELNLTRDHPLEPQDTSVYQPLVYIPKHNFWFKMIGLKIKKKYQLDIQTEDKGNQTNSKTFYVIFIKDASIEHFSLYSLKLSLV